MKKTLFTTAIVLTILIVGFLYFQTSKEIPSLSTEVVIEEIHSDSLNTSIFIRSISRGLNYKVIVISQTNKNFDESNPKNEFVYNWTPIFYQLKEDTLFVYTHKRVKQPVEFNSPIFVKQIELSNSKMMDLFNSYKDKGIKLIQ